ncbi:amino acid permease, partial [Flavobacteriaceae bacterium]|nr:amino acid permease [Flavobacteriaceae bacterium]
MAGTLITIVVYIMSTIAIMGIIPPDVLSQSNAPFADAAGLFWGDSAKYIVAAGAVIATLGALNGWILIQGQIPMAAAQDTLFPKIFGENADGSYDWDVYLLGDGITINSSTPVGQGAFIYLDLNTNSADGLVAGTYTYANERAPFTWVFADACASFNTSNFNCASGSYNASAGTVVISGSGNNTTIEVNLTDTSGASITASYTGGFSIID